MLAYQYNQVTPATTWTITHNMDLTGCSVEVLIDVEGLYEPILPVSITKTANEVVLTFSTARAGIAQIRGSTGQYVDYAGFIQPIERAIDYTHSPDVVPT